MIKIIKDLLLKVISDIDAGNSNLTEDQAIEIIKVIRNYSDTTIYYNYFKKA